MKDYFFIVTTEDEGERVDSLITSLIVGVSRSYVQKQIEQGLLLVNGLIKKSNYKVKTDDNISFSLPDAVLPSINPENIPIDIVYEDEDVCIVNKPQGMVVHPSCGHYSGTLVNALLFHLNGRLSGINGVMRPGIVHRIDKDTSGLLIICKTDFSHNKIADQLKAHSCNRIYHAIVHGVIKEEEGRINLNIGRDKNDRKKMAPDPAGKVAITNYRVLKRFKDYSYIECKLETGRTHQIRVHMKSIGHPLMGDPVYSSYSEPIKCNGQMLHAKTIGFLSPTKNEYLEFDSELPDYFKKALKYLEER